MTTSYSILGEAGKINFEQLKRHLSNKKIRQDEQREIFIQKKENRRKLKEKRSTRKNRRNK